MRRSAICLAALAALSISAALASAQTKSGVDKLYILNCGEGVAGDISRWSPGVDVGKSMDFVDNCYLIHHAQGWLLWDTGVTDAIAAMPQGQAPADPRMTHWRRPKTLASQLEALGVKPADIKYVAVSHTHPDHIGNVELFPQVMLLVQKAEYEWPSPLGVGRFKPEHPVKKLEGDHDVFGDGSITILATPGHQSARQTAEDRRARALGRRRALPQQLGKSPRAVEQHRQGPDARLDAAHRRYLGEGESPALDQSRQGAARRPEDGARVLRLREP
jgi:N-acyl homoserine lactone hydrolase